MRRLSFQKSCLSLSVIVQVEWEADHAWEVLMGGHRAQIVREVSTCRGSQLWVSEDNCIEETFFSADDTCPWKGRRGAHTPGCGGLRVPVQWGGNASAWGWGTVWEISNGKLLTFRDTEQLSVLRIMETKLVLPEKGVTNTELEKSSWTLWFWVGIEDIGMKCVVFNICS